MRICVINQLNLITFVTILPLRNGVDYDFPADPAARSWPDGMGSFTDAVAESLQVDTPTPKPTLKPTNTPLPKPTNTPTSTQTPTDTPTAKPTVKETTTPLPKPTNTPTTP
jgi:hypothetical protein